MKSLAQAYLLRGLPDAGLRDGLSGQGVTKGKADSLLLKYIFRYFRIAGAFQETHQFWVWRYDPLKLLTVGHR